MKPKILIQLDTDPQPSVFDAVVAVDAGVEHLFRHGGVTPANVRDLVYGALFTRGPADLSATAIFIGGSNVAAGEAVLEAVKKTFFGPFQVSVLFDANGANTTAAAAVLAALQSLGGSLEGVAAGRPGRDRPGRPARGPAALPAGGQGGRRLAQPRPRGRAGGVAPPGHRRSRHAVRRDRAPTTWPRRSTTCAVVISAGAAGVTLLPASVWQSLPDLKALIDLNAVPPLGIEGVEATDKNAERGHVRAWGALGVGGTKMKIHKKAIQELFTSNDKIFDAEQVLELGRSLS